MRNSVLSFEEIRPYRDEEVKAVMARLSQKHSFKILLQYFFPGQSIEDIEKGLQEVESSADFQDKYISKAILRMKEESTRELSHEGFEHIDKNQSYFYISNHRDIILDPGFLNFLFHREGFETTQNAIGDNLLVSGLVTDLMKMNKSFIVHRSVERKDMLSFSKRLSAYVYEVLESGQSIWMAQRSGRAKDGNDHTNPALLKMLNLSGAGEIDENFRQLNLVPMAISYEFEPCDMLKAEELVHQRMGLPYQKDDKVAMIRGIRDPKGRVHLKLGKSIGEKIRHIPKGGRINDYFKALANLLDREIWTLYKLWPNNFIAYDLLEGKDQFWNFYTKEEKQIFLDYMENKLKGIKGDSKMLKEQFLLIYANPLRNKLDADLGLY
ncbi:MAG: glycerol acyltransferase [Bacteroidia bacterium]|nr:glycerol acyltransferase [Bacteroidia bacterium]